ncbi:hypothetical protein ACWPKO_09775 [Coraliomargarita sp. W4R53]
MNLKKIALLFPAAATLLLTLNAQAQLVSDNFELRDDITLGDQLRGESSQIGDAVYGAPSTGNYFEFQNEDGVGVAKPTVGRGNSSSSFAIDELSSSGTIRFDATVNFGSEDAFNGSIRTAWIGFTEAENNLLYSNPFDHIAAGLIPSGDSAGRLRLRTLVESDTTESVKTNDYSNSSDALTISFGRDYDLTLEFNFDTLIATVTATDTISLSSTSLSTQLSVAPTLSGGQFDFTGISNTTASEDLPYFENISVIPEAANYASLSGCLALAIIMLRRRK